MSIGINRGVTVTDGVGTKLQHLQRSSGKKCYQLVGPLGNIGNLCCNRFFIFGGVW